MSLTQHTPYPLPVYFIQYICAALPFMGGRRWRSGTLSLVGLECGGELVKTWVVVASAASNIGQFTCEQAANAFQLEGMAEAGWLPKCFMHRSRRLQGISSSFLPSSNSVTVLQYVSIYFQGVL